MSYRSTPAFAIGAVVITLPNGSAVSVDEPIADLVRVLNENGYPTVASCSGHGFRPGNIALRDGRELIIARDHAEARKIDALFPLDINGDEIAETRGEQ